MIGILCLCSMCVMVRLGKMWLLVLLVMIIIGCLEGVMGRFILFFLGLV